MKKHTQKQDILTYLQTHKDGLTHRDAEELFGVMRLAAVVCQLRKDGHNIRTEDKRVPNRYGGYSYVANYVMEA